jgi:hypothetical protein
MVARSMFVLCFFDWPILFVGEFSLPSGNGVSDQIGYGFCFVGLKHELGNQIGGRMQAPNRRQPAILHFHLPKH